MVDICKRYTHINKTRWFKNIENSPFRANHAIVSITYKYKRSQRKRMSSDEMSKIYVYYDTKRAVSIYSD